jgi:hypothetical protein
MLDDGQLKESSICTIELVDGFIDLCEVKNVRCESGLLSSAAISNNPDTLWKASLELQGMFSIEDDEFGGPAIKILSNISLEISRRFLLKSVILLQKAKKQ